MRTRKPSVMTIVCLLPLLLALLAPVAGAADYITSAAGDWNLNTTWGGSGKPSSLADRGLINKGTLDNAVLATTNLGSTGNYPAIIVAANGLVAAKAAASSTGTIIANPVTFDGGKVGSGAWDASGGEWTGPITLKINGLIAAPGRNGSPKLSGKVSGPGGITITAPDQNGTFSGLTLNNASNDFAGRVVVTQGCLRVGVDHALPTGKVVLVHSEGRVACDVNQTYANETPPVINLHGGTFIVGSSAAEDKKILTNSFSVNVSALGGHLNSGDASWVGGRHLTGPITILAGGTLNVGGSRGGGWSLEGPISGAGAVRFHVFDAYQSAIGGSEIAGTNNTHSGGTVVATYGIHTTTVRGEGSLGTGPVTVEANTIMALDKTPNADWRLSNTLAGAGTFKVEDGSGSNRLTVVGSQIVPGTNSTGMGILTVDGRFSFARNGTGGTPAPTARDADKPVAAGVSPAGLAGQNASGKPSTLQIEVAGSASGARHDQLRVEHGDAVLASSITNAVLALNIIGSESALSGKTLTILSAPGADFNGYRFAAVTGTGPSARVIYDKDSVHLTWATGGLDIRSTGCSNLRDTSGDVHGVLVSAGKSPTEVRCYWGATAMDTGGWSYTNFLGTQSVGMVTACLTGLTRGTTYYYRFYATNASGECWSTETRSFTTTLDSLLAKAAVYADSNALGQARGILDAVVAGQAPTFADITALATLFTSQRLYEEGAAAMRAIAPFCKNDAIRAAHEEGKALLRSGRIAEGIAVLEAAPPHHDTRFEIAGEIENAKARLKVLGSVIITETVALRENLDACSRSATPGPAALKLLRSQGGQIFPRDDGSGVDAVEFIRQEAAKWPPAAGFQATMEAAAKEAGAALPEGDLRKFGDYWRVYQGTSPARQAAEKLADRLIDDSLPDMAMAWYGRLLQFDGSARLIAKYAYARSLTSAPGSLAEWMKSLSATVRATTVNVPAGWKPAATGEAVLTVGAGFQARPSPATGVMTNGNKALPLGEFVAGLPVKPPEPAAPSFPEGLKLAPGWKAPVLPSEGLRINRSVWFADRTAFERPIVLPTASGEAVFVNTGLSLRRYAADSGSNVWTCGFRPEVVDDLSGNGGIFVPFFPLPVFGAVVQDDLVVCRHAERITTIELLSSCGLTALDARTGALRWRTRDIPELAGWHVASEPCVDRGIVTFLVRGGSDEPFIRAVALEAHTGTLLWNRILVMGNDLRGTDGRFSETYGSELPQPLATSRGVCFATHMGRTFLLDALTGAVLWMQPYPRVLADAGAPRGPMNPLLAVGGAIVSAPYDSTRIFALEAATGKPLWDEPAALDSFLGGVWKGRLVTFGRGLRLRDAKSGATLAAEPLAWIPSAPVGFINGDRFWLADNNEARLYDLTTLKETGAVAAGQRLLPAGGLAVSCAPNVISAFRLGAAASAPVAPPGCTVRARTAPVGGAKRDVGEPVGEVAPRLLWTVSIPGSFSLPDEDRGLALVYGLYNAKLIDTDGFGEPYWEYIATNILRKVVWTDETVILATDVDLIGLELATGSERWRQPTKYPLGALYAQDDLFVVGVTNDTEVLRVNPKDGAIRWRCPMPSNQVARVLRESGGRLHVELRPAADPNTGWFIRELGADGKLGRELCGNANSRKDGIGFWELGADRVYTIEGSTYKCWDLERKTMLWKASYSPPNGQPITSKRVIASTPAGHPWWLLASRDENAVLDPLTGEVLYRGGSANWNSDVIEYVGNVRMLKRLSLEPGKAPREAWQTTFAQDVLRAIVLPESGAALRVFTVNYHAPFTLRLLDLDPATGKTLRNVMILPTGGEGLRAVWKYANSRIFLTSQQNLCAVAVMPVAGASAWYTERRQAALRIGDPVGRARALRFVNLSEQLFRQTETRWIASAGPLVLDQPWQWVPAEETTGPRVKDWAGLGDLSATLTAAMTAASTLKLVIEVRDNTWVPMDGGKGDAILIGKQVAFGLDSQYRPAITPATPENLALLGGATVSHAGNNLLRYMIELPWGWRNAGASNATNTQFDLSFAVRDDDGIGVKGTLEWARCMDSAAVRIEK